MTTKDNKRDQKGDDEERREQRKIEGKNRKRQTREKMRMRQGWRHIYTGWEMWREITEEKIAKRDIRKEINREKIMRGVRRFALLVLSVFPLLLFL